MSAKKSLLTSSLIMAVGLALGRVSGFIREVFIASYLGVSSLADGVIISLTLPDLLISLLVGGAASVVFIPLFQKSKENEASVFWTLSLISFGFFSLLSGFILIFPHFVFKVMAPGLSLDQLPSTYDLLFYTALTIPLVGLTSVSRALLQSHSRFFSTSLEGLFTNIGIIVGCLLVPYFSFQSILAGLFGGTLLRFGTQLFDSLSILKGQARRLSGELLTTRLFIPYFQALGAGTLLLVIPLLARTFGSYDGPGSIALFNYASKLMELPLGVVITVFSIVLFPTMSRLFQQDRPLEAKQVMDIGLSSIFVSALPLTAALLFLSWILHGLPSPTVRISTEDFQKLCELIAIGSLALPFRGLSSYHVAIFAAKGDLKTQMLINVFHFAASTVAFYFIGKQSGLIGIFLALSFVFISIYVCEVLCLRLKHKISSLEFLRQSALAKTVLFTVISLSLALPGKALILNQKHPWIWGLGLSVLFGGALTFVTLYMNRSGFKRLRDLRSA